MNALTIQQPYAYFITLPPTDPRHKRVENRTWAPHPSAIGQPIAIHAGKGTDYLKRISPFPYAREDLIFGSVIATGILACCWHIDRCPLPPRHHYHGPDHFAWVARHPHTLGPYCWVLEDVVPLAVPVPAIGRQGIWQCPLQERWISMDTLPPDPDPAWHYDIAVWDTPPTLGDGQWDVGEEIRPMFIYLATQDRNAAACLKDYGAVPAPGQCLYVPQVEDAPK